MVDTGLALHIDRFMRTIHASLQAKSADFDRQNVGPAGGMVLLTLADLGRPEMHELTERFARDKSQMTRVVQVLEVKGLVARATSKRDARARVVSLTPAGQQVVEELKLALAETIADLISPLSETEQATFRALMKRVALGVAFDS